VPSYEIGNNFAYLISVNSYIFAASKLSVDNICAVGSTPSLGRKLKTTPEKCQCIYYYCICFSTSFRLLLYPWWNTCITLYMYQPRNFFTFIVINNSNNHGKTRSYPTACLPLCVIIEILKRISMKYGNWRLQYSNTIKKIYC